MAIINKTNILSRLSAVAMIPLLMVSCSEDENLISISDGYIHTGEATEVTANSAVLNGSYNYFSTIGYLFSTIQQFGLYDGKIDTASLALYARSYHNPQTIQFSADCPDSVMISITDADADFQCAGVIYSENRDFYESVTMSADELKLNSFALKTQTVLKPATTYWYKSFIRVEPILLIRCKDQGISFYAQYSDMMEYLGLENDGFYDYCVYGDTKSFTTLH